MNDVSRLQVIEAMHLAIAEACPEKLSNCRHHEQAAAALDAALDTLSDERMELAYQNDLDYDSVDRFLDLLRAGKGSE